MAIRFKILFLSLIWLVYGINIGFCQQAALKPVPGMSPTAIYDLFADSKGFLWIGHSAGVSRYDGITFTGFSNTLQSSLAVTGFFEDKYGRIWFNNFSGQIFYIENGRMNLLSAYDNKSEVDYPDIGLFNDMLVATTRHGLFVCDINTLKCRYETCMGLPVKGTTSLCIFKNEVLVYGYQKWFFYKPGNGLKPAHFNKADSVIIGKNDGDLTARTFNDTAFVFCNPARVVYKITAANGQLKLCSASHFKYHVNSVTVLKNQYWVNTSRSSLEMPGRKGIEDNNLSCEGIDKQGHYWYGGLQNGLLTAEAGEGYTQNKIILPLKKDDNLSCLAQTGDKLLAGTTNGNLISYDPVTRKVKLLLTGLVAKHNGIRYIKMIDANNVILGSAEHTFIFNLPANKISRIYHYLVIRQADTVSRSMLCATSSGLIALPRPVGEQEYNNWKKQFNDQFKGFNEYTEAIGPYKFLDYVQRISAVCATPKTSTIWAELQSGLFKINNNGVVPYYYVSNRPVYASCLAACSNHVIAGTINFGVLIINDSSVKRLSTEDGLLSNSITKVKIAGSYLLIYNSGLVQLFDTATWKIIRKYQLPGINDEPVTDAEEVNGRLFLVSANALYQIPEKIQDSYSASIYPVALYINGRDTDITNHMRLGYNQNDVGINLAIPVLLGGRNVVFKYRLLRNNAGNWIYGKPGDRSVRFEDLSPGSYRFEVVAGELQSGISGRPLVIDFTIMPPWWRTWWALFAMIMAGVLIVTAILHLYYGNILAARKTEFEKKLAIEKERQRISSDMHDDIGASLSAIKLFAGNVKQSAGSAIAIPEIYDMVSNLSDRTREVIWSLSQVNDTLENLIYFIDSTANKLFEHSGIRLRTILPDEISDCKIDNDKRRDIYLILKEALNNIIKHADATEALLEFIIINNGLSIKVHDNGIGFPNHSKEKINGQGMINIKNRVKNLGGEWNIEFNNGTIINLFIPL